MGESLEPHWFFKDSNEIEKLISPFNHIRGKERQKVIDKHVQSALEETLKAQQEIASVLDIPYGNISGHLDIYGTNLSPTSPVFLWVHGGAWITGGKEWSGFFVRNLIKFGFKSVLVGYTLMPDASSIREMCTNIETAVEKAMRLFPEAKFVLAGHSAGAQLIANILSGTSSKISGRMDLVERISGFALISGLMDIRTIQKTVVNELLNLTLEEATELSPVLNVHKISDNWLKKRKHLKILVALGKNDPSEFHRQGKLLTQKLLDGGFTQTEYWESEEDDHFTIIENFSKEESLAAKKLKEFLLQATFSSRESRL